MKTSLQYHQLNESRDKGMFFRGVVALLLAGACLVLAVAPSDAADPATSQKMLRQIGVMEKIIDKVLVDSPNVLVSGMGNTRGLYVDPYGVVFTFTASILRGDSDSPLSGLTDWSFSTDKDQYEMTTDKDGNQVITIKKSPKKKEKSDEGSKEALEDSAKEDEHAEQEGHETVWQRQRAKKYEAAKAELIQTILDYGETITSLKPGQNLLIAGFLKDDDFFRDEKISRFVLKAKVDDLRAFSTGDLTESAMRAKILIEEY